MYTKEARIDLRWKMAAGMQDYRFESSMDWTIVTLSGEAALNWSKRELGS